MAKSSFLKKVQMRESITAKAALTKNSSFRQRVEAKYKILDTIKKLASNLLKKLLVPALFLVSSTSAMAQIKNPDAMGQTFQKIAEQSLDGYKNVKVKTTVVENGEDDPQAVVYTLTAIDEDGRKQVSMIKYIEGKKAATKLVSGEGLRAVNVVVDEFRDTLDNVAKSVAKKGGVKSKNVKQLADNKKIDLKRFD